MKLVVTLASVKVPPWNISHKISATVSLLGISYLQRFLNVQPPLYRILRKLDRQKMIDFPVTEFDAVLQFEDIYMNLPNRQEKAERDHEIGLKFLSLKRPT